MYSWDGTIPPPIQEAMRQAGPPLLLSDTAIEAHGVRPVDIKRWCQANLKSFVWMEEQDVSDSSLQWDYIYAFFIGSEQDRNWFILRWGSK